MLIIILTWLLPINVYSNDLSAVDSEALENTVNLLKNRSQRQKVINGSKEAQGADDMAKQLMGEGQDLESLYQVAGEIFRQVANESNGDSSLMMKHLSDAQKNPEAFYKMLNNSNKDLIKQLSDQIKKSNPQFKESTNQAKP